MEHPPHDPREHELVEKLTQITKDLFSQSSSHDEKMRQHDEKMEKHDAKMEELEETEKKNIDTTSRVVDSIKKSIVVLKGVLITFFIASVTGIYFIIGGHLTEKAVIRRDNVKMLQEEIDKLGVYQGDLNAAMTHLRVNNFIYKKNFCEKGKFEGTVGDKRDFQHDHLKGVDKLLSIVYKAKTLFNREIFMDVFNFTNTQINRGICLSESLEKADQSEQARIDKEMDEFIELKRKELKEKLAAR